MARPPLAPYVSRTDLPAPPLGGILVVCAGGVVAALLALLMRALVG